MEKETIKNPKEKNQTNSEKSIVSDAAHRTGVNNTTARQKQRYAQIAEKSATTRNCRTKQK